MNFNSNDINTLLDDILIQSNVIAENKSPIVTNSKLNLLLYSFI